MKFGDQEGKCLRTAVDVHCLRILRHALPEVDAPLTGNVIRDDNVEVLRALETTEKHEIHVHVADGKVR